MLLMWHDSTKVEYKSDITGANGIDQSNADKKHRFNFENENIYLIWEKKKKQQRKHGFDLGKEKQI